MKSQEKLICHTIFNFFHQFSLQIRKTKASLANFAIDTSNQKANEDRITIMIMMVVGIFVACNSFQFAYNVYQAYRGPNFNKITNRVMYVVTYFIAILNSSVNAVVYGIFSKKYREVFVEYFCCKKSVQVKIEMRTVITKNEAELN